MHRRLNLDAVLFLFCIFVILLFGGIALAAQGGP